jgi:hypothetical protein
MYPILLARGIRQKRGSGVARISLSYGFIGVLMLVPQTKGSDPVRGQTLAAAVCGFGWCRTL